MRLLNGQNRLRAYERIVESTNALQETMGRSHSQREFTLKGVQAMLNELEADYSGGLIDLHVYNDYKKSFDNFQQVINLEQKPLYLKSKQQN